MSRFFRMISREKPPISVPMEELGAEDPDDKESWLGIFRSVSVYKNLSLILLRSLFELLG